MRTLDDASKRLPKQRREKILRTAQEKIAAIRLQQAREQAGLSQQELAARMAMTQPALSRVEHRADVRVSTIVRYVKAMGGGDITITATVPSGKRKGAPLKKIVLYGTPAASGSGSKH